MKIKKEDWGMCTPAEFIEYIQGRKVIGPIEINYPEEKDNWYEYQDHYTASLDNGWAIMIQSSFEPDYYDGFDTMPPIFYICMTGEKK